MNALADKVHKQGIPQIYIHVAVALQLALNLLLIMYEWLLNNVAMLWSAYHYVAFLVCVFCQPMHSLSNQLDFF